MGIRSLIKKALPRPVFAGLQKLRGKKVQQDRPRLTSYPGPCPSVLQACIAYNRHGGYCLPNSALHRPAAQAVLVGEIWEEQTIELLVSRSEAGDIVHAGTFFGDFLPALSRGCADGAKVWAFEPNPESFRCAQMTVAINQLQNVELTNAGLGAAEGEWRMAVAEPDGRALGGSSYITSKSDEQNRTVAVRIVAIDALIPADRRIAIIQLDTEGFELPALQGALGTIQRCRPLLVLETMPDAKWMADHILSLGYEVTCVVQENTVLVCRSS